jgi:hypothetical protein
MGRPTRVQVGCGPADAHPTSSVGSVGHRDTTPFTTWLPVPPGTDVWDLLPAPSEHLHALHAELAQADLEPSMLERCRARMEALVRGEGDPTAGEATSDAERAAIGFAEQFVLDPRGVTDAQAEELHRLFTPPQLAALTTAVATFDAVARVRAVLADPAGVPATIAVPLN